MNDKLSKYVKGVVDEAFKPKPVEPQQQEQEQPQEQPQQAEQ